MYCSNTATTTAKNYYTADLQTFTHFAQDVCFLRSEYVGRAVLFFSPIKMADEPFDLYESVMNDMFVRYSEVPNIYLFIYYICQCFPETPTPIIPDPDITV